MSRTLWLALAALVLLTVSSMVFLPRGSAPRPAPSIAATAASAAPVVDPSASTTAVPAQRLGADGLPDEVRIAPKLRRAPRRPELPPGPLADWFEDYKARAQGGDAEASYVLAIALTRCAGVATDDAAVRTRFAGITQRPKGLVEAQGYDMVLSVLIANNRESAAYCAGVPKPTSREAWDLLEQAVQLGSLEAVPSYLWTPPSLAARTSLGLLGLQRQGEPTDAERHFQAGIAQRQLQLALDAQSRGSEQAILWLARRAHVGIDARGTEDSAARDPVSAYAGFLAYKMLRAATDRGIDTDTAQAIAEYERSLRPDEGDAAIARALRIVSAPDCCLVSDP